MSQSFGPRAIYREASAREAFNKAAFACGENNDIIIITSAAMLIIIIITSATMLIAIRQANPIHILFAHARMHQGSRRLSAKAFPPIEPQPALQGSACAFLRGSDPQVLGSCKAPTCQQCLWQL